MGASVVIKRGDPIFIIDNLPSANFSFRYVAACTAHSADRAHRTTVVARILCVWVCWRSLELLGGRPQNNKLAATTATTTTNKLAHTSKQAEQ